MTAPTLRSLVREVAGRLDDAGVPSPEADAAALVAHAASLPVSELRVAQARGDAVPATLDASALEDAVARRGARVPLQHITGEAPFRTLTLAVGPGVFVPRPETEAVAGFAIDAATTIGGEPAVADLCAGSGAIGLAVATEIPTSRVVLVELDAKAFAYLERNVSTRDAGVRDRVRAIRGDARTALADRDGTFDVVVSNPPYVPHGATPRDVEVAEHDPPVALYGLGGDGLEVARGIVGAAARLLRPGGVVAMEHGEEQGEAVRAIISRDARWRNAATHRDLTGRPRFTVATRA